MEELELLMDIENIDLLSDEDDIENIDLLKNEIENKIIEELDLLTDMDDLLSDEDFDLLSDNGNIEELNLIVDDDEIDNHEKILDKIPEISKITNVEPKILIENMDGLIKIIKETNTKTVDHLDKLNQTIMRNGDIFKNILLKISSGPIIQQSTSRYSPDQTSENLGPPPPPAIPLTTDQKQARSVFQPPSKDDLAEMLKKLRKTKPESTESSVGEGIRRKKRRRRHIMY